MEIAIRVQVEELPEGAFLATSHELPGLVAQGRTVAETLDIARDVARKLIEARARKSRSGHLFRVIWAGHSDSGDYTPLDFKDAEGNLVVEFAR